MLSEGEPAGTAGAEEGGLQISVDGAWETILVGSLCLGAGALPERLRRGFWLLRRSSACQLVPTSGRAVCDCRVLVQWAAGGAVRALHQLVDFTVALLRNLETCSKLVQHT